MAIGMAVGMAVRMAGGEGGGAWLHLMILPWHPEPSSSTVQAYVSVINNYHIMFCYGRIIYY